MILIVDDEADIRLLARLVLESAGYEVVEAADGTEAIRILGGPGIDAMVLDLRMAPVDGWAVLEHLQALARVPGLPVVVLSAHADPAMEARALRLGCTSYMSKPFDPADLLTAVGTGVGGDR